MVQMTGQGLVNVLCKC